MTRGGRWNNLSGGGELTTDRARDVLKWSAVKPRDLKIWVLDERLALAASN